MKYNHAIEIYKQVGKDVFHYQMTFIYFILSSCKTMSIRDLRSPNSPREDKWRVGPAKSQCLKQQVEKKCVRVIRSELTIPLYTRSPSLNQQDCPEYRKHSLYSSLVNGSLQVCGNDPRICHKIHNFHRSNTKYSFALVINSHRQKQR